MIRLIVSDIDGTLVPEGGSSVNPEYMDVIRELRGCGVEFAAASGRQASSIDAVFHEVSDRIYYLSDNGAYIQRYQVPAREVRMCETDVTALLCEAEKIEDCHILLSTKDGYYTSDTSEAFYRLVFEQYRGTGAVVERAADYAPECIKLSLFSDKGSLYLHDLLYERWKERFSINISGARWLDINDYSATKGNAVQWIQEQLSVTPQETVVFGDNYNDISMLERAERSYASVLSHPDVKAAARYEVASYEEDGVLAVLKELLKEIKDAR